MNNLFTKKMALILLLSLLFTATAAIVTVQELDSALFALRSRGYTLFPNAITTSDLRLLLLTLNSSFTLFSPPDPSVYSLDISSTAAVYVNSLLRHVSPVHLSMSDMRSIRGNTFLDTLVPPHRMSIVRSLAFENDSVSESILVDGVRVSVPDIFLGSGIAVHGLDGMLVAGLGSNSQEQADHIGDAPVLSPASWFERESPASSSTPLPWSERESPASSPRPVSWFEREFPASSTTPVSWFERESPASSPTPVSWSERESPASSPTPVSWSERESPASSPTPVPWSERESPASSPAPVPWSEQDYPASSLTPVSLSEQDSPASSPTPEAGLRGKKNDWNQQGFNSDFSNDGIEIENSKFAKYIRRFGL